MNRRRERAEICAEYKRRERRVVQGLLTLLVLGGGVLLAILLIDGQVGGLVFLAAAFIWAVWFYRNWRCPACGRSLILSDPESRPSHCPSCEVQLEP
jgi:hypothetical protein